MRLYDYDKRSKHGKASLWWTLAEILAVVEGDGISPDSLLEVRLFKEYIKHVSNYAVSSPFERDSSSSKAVSSNTPSRRWRAVEQFRDGVTPRRRPETTLRTSRRPSASTRSP